MAAISAQQSVEWLDEMEPLDRIAEPLQRRAAQLLGRYRPWLRGDWLGHPLHPALTDLPIGFWTAAFVLDFTGKRQRRAADLMVALGVVTAVPTAAAGLADWSAMEDPKRRSGLIHAAANLAATAIYTASLVARLRGHRLKGVALALLGSALATAGGYLGGHLVFDK